MLSLGAKHIMTSSQQFFSLLFFLLLFPFPLLHASHPQDCSSSSTCENNVHVHFPFWLLSKQPETRGYPGFNLSCTDQHKTVLEFPKSGKFFVRTIDYLTQQILLYDPKNCLAGRLLSFDTSVSPFSPHLRLNYTFLSCPTQVIKSRYAAISCLSDSTSSVLATSNTDLVSSMPPSCQIIKTLPVPVSWPVPYNEGFSTDLNDYDLRLTWNSPDCRDCERNQGRCGFNNNATLETGCFYSKKPGKSSSGFQVFRVICLSIAAPAAVLATGIALFVCVSDRFTSRRQNAAAAAAAAAAAVAPQPDIATTGLDESTIQSYKKLELGESRRLPGPNGTTCPICLSEYESKETVRCIPDCEHCFHTECIDEWLRMHTSCPICRKLPSPPPAREEAPAVV